MKIALMSATILALAMPVWAADVQIRLAHDKPGPNSEQLEIVHQDQSAAIKQLVFVDNKTLVNQSDIKSAELDSTSGGTPQIKIDLTDEGARAVRHDNRRNVALVVDGRALVTGELRREKAGTIDLTGDFSRDEAQRAVNQINQTSAQR